MMRNRHVTCVGHVTWVGVALHEPVASSSRSQVPGQAARAVACLTSGVVSTVVHQRPWLNRGGSYSLGYSAPARSAGGWAA
jgi:hypothetical protein